MLLPHCELETLNERIWNNDHLILPRAKSFAMLRHLAEAFGPSPFLAKSCAKRFSTLLGEGVTRVYLLELHTSRRHNGVIFR